MRSERTSKYSLSLIEQQKTSKMTNWLPENRIPLMNAHQKTVINTSMHEPNETSQFRLNRLTNKKFHRKQHKFLK